MVAENRAKALSGLSFEDKAAVTTQALDAIAWIEERMSEGYFKGNLPKPMIEKVVKYARLLEADGLCSPSLDQRDHRLYRWLYGSKSYTFRSYFKCGLCVVTVSDYRHDPEAIAAFDQARANLPDLDFIEWLYSELDSPAAV